MKLIAALEAIGHPGRPFEIDLPRVGARATTFVDPMVVVHGGHAHALQSPLFPPLSAPFIAAFGLRGAYVLPALAFVALCSAARSAPAPGRARGAPPLLAWLAIAANPLLFYALEYLGARARRGAAAGGTAAVALAARAPWLASGLAAAGGALVGAGVLLRPEGAWYAAGLLVTRRAAAVAGVRRAAPRPWRLPFATANYLHFGNPLGAHASAVLAPIGVGFVAEARWARAARMAVASLDAGVAGLLLVAAAWLSTPWAKDLRARQLIGAARHRGRHRARGTAERCQKARSGRASRWRCSRSCRPPLPRAIARRLYVLAATAAAGVVLTATNDGGAQWGVRYLLIAAPPLLLLAARAATDAAGAGRWRALRLAAVGLICLAGAMTSRAAFLELRGAKRSYDGLVTAVAVVHATRRHRAHQRVVARPGGGGAARLAHISVRQLRPGGRARDRDPARGANRRRHARVDHRRRGALSARGGARRHLLSHRHRPGHAVARTAAGVGALRAIME